MTFKALYHRSGIPDPDVSMILAIDNLIERGYTIADCESMGFSLPDVPELPLILAGVVKGKERHSKRLQRDAESKARMST